MAHNMECDYCGEKMRNYEMSDHLELCVERQIYEDEKRKREHLIRQGGDAAMQALGSFIAMQDLGLPAPKFPMTWTHFVMTMLAGNIEDRIKACRKFVEACRPLLVNAENERKERS